MSYKVFFDFIGFYHLFPYMGALAGMIKRKPIHFLIQKFSFAFISGFRIKAIILMKIRGVMAGIDCKAYPIGIAVARVLMKFNNLEIVFLINRNAVVLGQGDLKFFVRPKN